MIDANEMDFLNEIEGVDVYLLDQLMKGTIKSSHRILDAGCGNGRNLALFYKNKWNAVGIDPNDELIRSLKDKFQEYSDRLFVTSIEDYRDTNGFDVIVCNAVLHFAKNHSQFDTMFSQLNQNLKPGGLLFIRMTSDIGLNFEGNTNTGVYLLPDNSYRYLITRKRISELLREFQYELLDPIKTVNVNDLRCMTTLVFRKGF
jgi:tellurite methyltransferase